jgi:hypothetical protein
VVRKDVVGGFDSVLEVVEGVAEVGLGGVEGGRCWTWGWAEQDDVGRWCGEKGRASKDGVRDGVAYLLNPAPRRTGSDPLPVMRWERFLAALNAGWMAVVVRVVTQFLSCFDCDCN